MTDSSVAEQKLSRSGWAKTTRTFTVVSLRGPLWRGTPAGVPRWWSQSRRRESTVLGFEARERVLQREVRCVSPRPPKVEHRAWATHTWRLPQFGVSGGA